MHDVMLAAAPEDNLSTLVKEAFIDPIRSVLIIDDRYPTWEKIFSAEGYDHSDTDKWAERDNVLQVIRQFRSKSPSMIVDIHDGSNNESIEEYLHQSDLLILDYQLEPEQHSGDKAVCIIRHLTSNNHFNLIVLHTQTEDLTEPFNKILLSILSPVTTDENRLNRAKAVIDKVEDNLGEDFQSQLEDSLTEAGYIMFRKALAMGSSLNCFMEISHEAIKFRDLCDNAELTTGERRLLSYWALKKHERRMQSDIKERSGITWHSPDFGGVPWIRTRGGFIAFAQKSNEDLLGVLRSALEGWKPTPSRMISSRIRAEISSLGVMAEDSTFTDRRAHWKYYQELLSSDDNINQRKTLIEGHAARHVERLLDHVGTKAIEFGLRVVECDPRVSTDNERDFSKHYGLTNFNDAELAIALNHYNAYISTKAVSGWHLQPGHIINVCNEYWVCVSPACDLVPGQKGQIGFLGSKKAKTKPFMAVKLHQCAICGRADVNSNTVVFLSDADTDTVQTFSVFPEGGASPVWRMMLASNFGTFTLDEEKTAALSLQIISGESGELRIETEAAKIVGQLRYEYALNLVHKLGVELTRIGLDFVAPPEE